MKNGMKLWWIVVFSISFCGCLSPAPASTSLPSNAIGLHNQSISGEIDSDQTWSGTILVTGDVWVKEGVTLTILPGTKIIMTAHHDDQKRGEVDPGFPGEPPGDIEVERKAGYPSRYDNDTYVKTHISIEVRGKLDAKGTADERIVFTSDNPSPTMYDWYKLEIREGTLEYALVEYARQVTIVGPDVKIANCIIRHMLEGSISLGSFDKNAIPVITQNEIYDCGNECIAVTSGSPVITYNTLRPARARMYPGYGGTGIVIWEKYFQWQGIRTMGTPLIEHNLIEEANWNGIVYRCTECSPIIRYNTIRNCTTGINIEPYHFLENAFVTTGVGNPLISENNIYDNHQNNVNNMVMYDFNLSYNWWGTTDLKKIDEKIWDNNDEKYRGKILYVPILSSPIP